MGHGYLEEENDHAAEPWSPASHSTSTCDRSPSPSAMKLRRMHQGGTVRIRLHHTHGGIASTEDAIAAMTTTSDSQIHAENASCHLYLFAAP